MLAVVSLRPESVDFGPLARHDTAASANSGRSCFVAEVGPLDDGQVSELLDRYLSIAPDQAALPPDIAARVVPLLHRAAARARAAVLP